MKKGIVQPFLLLLTFTVLIIGALFWLNKEPQITKQSRETLPSSEFNTANWKPYSNPKYNYSFKYPAKLTPKQLSQSPLGEQVVFYENIESMPKFTATLYIAGAAYTIGMDFDQLYNLEPNSSTEIDNKVVGHFKLTNNKRTKINGLEAFEYKRDSLPVNPSNPEVGVGLFISVGNFILILEAAEDDMEIIKQIASTVASI